MTTLRANVPQKATKDLEPRQPLSDELNLPSPDDSQSHVFIPTFHSAILQVLISFLATSFRRKLFTSKALNTKEKFLIRRWRRAQRFIKLTETPHVDGRSVGEAEDDFGWPIEAGLNVRVHLAVWVARASKIDDFDRTAATLLQQHIFLPIKNLIEKLFTCLLEGSVNRKFSHNENASDGFSAPKPGRVQQ